MAGKNTSVMALFPNEAAIDSAISTLCDNGFRSADISVLMAQNSGSKAFAHEKDTKAPEGAVTGSSAGAVIGGALGLLTGIGALAIPGVGPFIAAGPIMAALAGLGVGGAVGGVAGGLIGLGIPEYEAKRYEGMIKEGRALLSVHCDKQEWVQKAKDLLKDCGGQDISSRGEAKATMEGTKTDRPFSTYERPAGSFDAPVAGMKSPTDVNRPLVP